MGRFNIQITLSSHQDLKVNRSDGVQCILETSSN